MANYAGIVPDMSGTFATLGDLGKTYQESRDRRTLSDLGKQLAAGTIDYKQAAALAADANKLDLSMNLLKLGQSQEENANFDRAWFGGGGQPTPAAPGGSQPAAPPMSPGVTSGPRPANAPPLMQGGAVNLPPPAPPVTTARAPVPSSPTVWGDREAEEAGLYEPTTTGQGTPAPGSPLPRPQVAQAQPQAPLTPPAPREPLPNQGPPQGGAQPNANLAGFTPRQVQLMRAVSNSNLSESRRGMAKLLLEKDFKDNATTDEIREYKLYESQQRERGQPALPFLDYKMQLKRAGATAITTDLRTENAEAAALGKGAGERAVETMSAAGKASKKLQQVARMSALLENVRQGKIEPARMSVSAWAKSLGLNDERAIALGLDPKRVGDAQAVTALSNEMLLGNLGPGGFPAQNFSDTDRKFMEAILPQLANDPRGNKIILEIARRSAQRDIEKAREWQNFRRNNKGASFFDFELQWADKIAKADVFGDLQKEAESIIGTATTQPPQAPAPPSATGDGWNTIDGVRIRRMQ